MVRSVEDTLEIPTAAMDRKLRSTLDKRGLDWSRSRGQNPECWDLAVKEAMREREVGGRRLRRRRHLKDAAQDVAEDVAEDVAQHLAFGARAARALLATPPPPPPPPSLCSSR